MTRRRSRAPDLSQIRPRAYDLGSLRAGDMVKLTSAHGSFKFLSVALDSDGTVAWVDLYGGTAGRESLRTVTVDRLKIPTERALARQRKARRDRRDD